MKNVSTKFQFLYKGACLLVSLFALAAAFSWNPAPVYAADTINTSEYLDTNNDGAVDTIRWTMDENVTACAYDAVDWTVNTPGDINVSITGVSCTGADAILNVNITADAGETGSTVNPVISYDNDDANNSITLTSGNMANHASIAAVDNADPVLTSAHLSSVGSRNRMSFTYTEVMTVVDGASSGTKGDTDVAGTVDGFGSFATPGDVTVPTGLNTVGGNGTATLYINLADQAGGYMNSASSTEPSGNFTPVASVEVIDANSNQVNINVTPGQTSAGWDLIKPTVTSVTVLDAAGSNGRIDQAVIVFDSAVRDSNITNANADLGTAGTTTGTFTTGVADDASTTFNRSADDNSLDTSVAAGDFTYDGLTTKITDLAGNLLNTAVDGTIATADVVENDGASPIILSARYLDNNTNGAVDRVQFTTTTDVGIGCSSFTGNTDFTVGTPGTVTLASAAGDTCQSNGTSTVTILLATPGLANTTGGAVSPVVTYTQPGNGVEDGAGNDVPTAAGITVTDGASPIITGAFYEDNNTNGAVDRVRFSTSADVGIACTGFTGNADFTVGTPGTVTLASAAGDTCQSNGTSTVTILLATPGLANTTGGAVSPVVTYTQPGNGVEDGAGNDVPTAAGVSVLDGAAPVYVSSATLDNNGNGTVDYIKVVYSEDIDDTSVASADYEAGINNVDPTAGMLLETFNSGSPGADVVDDETIYVNVLSGTDILSANATNYTLRIKQVGGVDDMAAAPNTLASFVFQTSADGAGPVIVSGDYFDDDNNGTVEKIILNYSENTTFTMAGGDWDFNLANDLGMANDFDASECAGTGTPTITCTDAGTGTFVSDADETGVGTTGTEPDWTFTTSANVKDALNNNAPTQAVTLEDNAAPLVVDADLDYRDNVSTLVVNFTEEVSAASADETKFHINNATGVDDVTLSQATASADGISLTFDLTEAERVAALAISGVAGGDAGAVVLDTDAIAVTDTALGGNTNVTDDNNTVNETADTNAPVLNQWDLNYTTNQLTLTFSETVDAGTLTPTAITIQDAATATLSYTLTGGSTASPDGTTIVVDLLIADVNAIKAVPLLAKTTANAYLRTTASLIDDMGTVANAAIVDGSALQANSVTGTASFGNLNGSLFLSSNVINESAKAGITFTVVNTLPANGKIELTFPAVFTVAGASGIESVANMNGGFTVTNAGQVVTITRNGLGNAVLTGTTVSFDLNYVVNPATPGTTPDFVFKTKDSLDAIIDQDVSVLGQNIIMPTVPVNPTPTGGGGGGGGGSGGGYQAPGSYLLNPIGPGTGEEEATGEVQEAAPETEEPSAFEDTAGHWAETYINEIANLGIVSGKTDTEFAPDDNISRAELLKIALGAFDYTIPEELAEKPLPDIEIGEWYAPYVQAAFDHNLIYGFENGLEPNAAASRGMSATVLAKAAKFDDIDQHFTENYSSHSDWTYAHFPDVLMNAYYAPFVAYLYDKGIIGGYEDGTYGPGNPITRAEIAKIVVKLLENYTPATSEEPAVEEPAAPAEETSALESADAEMMDGQGL